jgi:hypothetical protein
MKKLIFFPMFLLVIFSSCEYDRGVSEAYMKYRFHEGVTTITVPGWAIRLASRLGEMEKEERELLQSIDKVRILTIENNDLNARVNLHKEFYRKIRENNELEELMAVRNDGDQVTIFGKTDEDVIHELIILVGGNDNALIHIKGRLKPETVASLANKNQNNSFFSFMHH